MRRKKARPSNRAPRPRGPTPSGPRSKRNAGSRRKIRRARCQDRRCHPSCVSETASAASCIRQSSPFDTATCASRTCMKFTMKKAQSGGANPPYFCMGGPGAGSDKRARQFFDPRHYRIVVFDQRGCGRSPAEARASSRTRPGIWSPTSNDCASISGIERWAGIRRIVGQHVGRWPMRRQIPERVRELVLRGIFLLRYAANRWFYQHGASDIFPGRVGSVPRRDPDRRTR